MFGRKNESGADLVPTLLGVSVAMLVVAIILIVGLAVRPTGGLKVPAGYNVVHMDEFTYGFRVPSVTLPAGRTLFVDTNRGAIGHEFVLFKTDLPTNRLPLLADKSVDEDAKELENVADSGSDIAPGDTRLISADLESGHYAMVCNLPDHYGLGMRLDITVK